MSGGSVDKVRAASDAVAAARQEAAAAQVRLAAVAVRYADLRITADRAAADPADAGRPGRAAGTTKIPGCRRYHRGKTHAWMATLHDRDGVDWTMPDGNTYRCLDDRLPIGLDWGSPRRADR